MTGVGATNPSSGFNVNTGSPGLSRGALLSNQTATGMAAPPSLIEQARDKNPLVAGNALRQIDAQTGDVAKTNAKVAQAVAEVCRIEVRFTPVAGGLANHAYVYTQDARSDAYFRAGPSGEGPGGSSSGQLGSGSSGSASQSSNSNSNSSGSDSGNSSSPGSSRGGAGRNNGSWGAIRASVGDEARRIESGSPISGSQVVGRRAGDCSAVNASMRSTANRINEAQIPYNPFSTNSNASARTYLEGIGITGVSPSVTAPGWDTQLPLGR